jgi:hypothetical protein
MDFQSILLILINLTMLIDGSLINFKSRIIIILPDYKINLIF